MTIINNIQSKGWSKGAFGLGLLPITVEISSFMKQSNSICESDMSNPTAAAAAAVTW